ncbi:hypothetical protein ZHAS_00006971 [Anopheles sinensis]|uniref:Uncharacterized protein n=1 Tax=Anopheles sinensis TaxID=74873 RepID=A0A084VND3_ANOSI|nr:hypothetical protein ZHAS_00006971 [Anopheles sinensis]
MAGKAPKGKRIVMRGNAPKESESMNNIFHQTDETFYETQYYHGFTTHVPPVAGPSRPSSAAIDNGEQMKRLMENESKPLKEQYRELLQKKQHPSQQDPVGGSKFLGTVDSLAEVKNLTHGTKSRVEQNFSSIIFPGCSSDTETVPARRAHSDGLGDTWHTMTHGKRTNSDRHGGCFWKILNHYTDSSSSMADVGGEKKVEMSQAIESKSCSLQPEVDAITQQEKGQNNSAINQALQYLHKLRAALSQSGAIQRTRDELKRAAVDGTGDYDWNASLVKQVGTGETLDYGVLDPLLRSLEIDPKTREGFTRLLDLLDDEMPSTNCDLG